MSTGSFPASSSRRDTRKANNAQFPGQKAHSKAIDDYGYSRDRKASRCLEDRVSSQFFFKRRILVISGDHLPSPPENVIFKAPSAETALEGRRIVFSAGSSIVRFTPSEKISCSPQQIFSTVSRPRTVTCKSSCMSTGTFLTV